MTATAPTTPTGHVRLVVNLAGDRTHDVAGVFVGLCRRNGLGIADGIRRAITIWKIVDDAERAGEHVLIRERRTLRPDVVRRLRVTS